LQGIQNILNPIIGPLTTVLVFLTGVLHSYGLAIIVFTILVRGVLAPLNLRQLQSAKKMAALAPRIKELQQKYKGNREEMTRAQMALYKEAGTNPAAGCLPLLIQMPILYALFYVFRDLAKAGTATIYHQPFLWFVLDKPDHLFGAFVFPHSAWGPLPVLAALAQWVQQRMMMQPTSDPQQRSTQQIMQFMPLLILVFATNYPAGLALYWVTSTLFSITMQYFITGWGQLFKSPFRIPEAGGPTPPPAPRRPTPTTPAGNGDDRGTGATITPLRPRRPSTPPTAADGDGQAGPESEDDARLGKMQRAAMRSKARPRPKGAKR
jgi:YidC/Oxa1 family membrane protein insertase